MAYRGNFTGVGMAAGQNLAEGIQRARMTREELDALNMVATQYAANGLMSPEELDKFMSSGIGGKRAMVSQGLTRSLMTQKQQGQQARAQAEADKYYIPGGQQQSMVQPQPQQQQPPQGDMPPLPEGFQLME